MEIRISRKAVIRLVVSLGLPVFILAVYWIGTRVTPYAQGAPLLLSPALRESIAYRAQAREWTRQLREIDAGLVRLQADRQADVYEQTRQVEIVLSSALQLAQEVELRRAPSALAGLRTLLLDASRRYYATAQAAAQWVGAPTPENGDSVGNSLASARATWSALSESRWLTDDAGEQPASQPGTVTSPGASTRTPDPLDLPAP